MNGNIGFGFTLGFIVAIFIAGAATLVRDEWTIRGPLNECERANNVYQCNLVPTPVDPFHPEE